VLTRSAQGDDHAPPRAAPDDFRGRVRDEIARTALPAVAEAERERRFPKEVVREFGAAGLFRERWAGPDVDHGKGVAMAEELGRAGLGGVGIGITVQAEAVLGTLTWFGREGLLAEYAGAALDGGALGCVAASESQGGSDLMSVRTAVTPDGDGWRVRGRKWFVSPGGAADFVIALCRLAGDADVPGAGGLTVALIPEDGFRVDKRLRPAGCRSLETARLTIDARIPDELLIGPPGAGLQTITWGLTLERLATGAQLMGVTSLAIALATTHLQRRQQFGARLFDHQALRLRLASLAAEVSLARLGVYATAGDLRGPTVEATRHIAGVKVTTARLAERVLNECMHMFGGPGLLEDETPLARLAADFRLTRLGAGSDEMMWEIVAAGLKGDDALYDAMVSIERED
jgi:alkylation response protein AidB-like acyl-CoA dehydrogenase